MNPSTNRPALVQLKPENVPEDLRKSPRWAPWRAVWNEKKSKYEKVPHRATRPEYGLSNKNASGWVNFDEAVAAYEANLAGPPLRDANGKRIEFGGVGYLMTGAHGITGVDLDRCRDPKTGEIAPWAAELVARLDTYTEVSPSGTGLHAMLLGDVPEDWANHDQGIEIYGGNKARFLCITGELVPGARGHLIAPPKGYMTEVAGKYRKAPTKAEVEDLHLPDLLPVEFLPALDELELPTHARNFLLCGPDTLADRSKELIKAATALAETGLPPDEVLSILEANEHAMEVALDHRGQDYDKALRFLWRHSAVEGAKRAEAYKQLSLDEFEDLEPGEASPQAAEDDPMADFEALDDEGAEPPAKRDLGPVKAPRFTPVMPATFLKRKPASWIIKGFMPRAGLAVIFGASGSGKTFLTLDISAAIVRGTPWRGMGTKRGRGVYIVAEGASGFRNRLEAYCEFHGLDPEDFDIGVIADAPNLLDKADIRDLLKALIAFGHIDFIVIDTYARVMAGGNENDAKDVGQAVAHCDVIHRKTGALVILVHHSGKDPSRGARGSGALRAAADVEIEVEQTKQYRAATVTKMKDGEDGKEYRFRLQEVVIGQDEDGDPVTSCVVEHRDGPPDGSTVPKDVPKGAINQTVLDTVATLSDLGGPATYNDTLDACIAQIPLEDGKRDRRRELVVRAIERLETSGHLILGGGTVVIAK